MTRVTSTGRKNKPHCSSSHECEFNDDSKKKCAEALCKAQNFMAATFHSSSNNFCTTSFSNTTQWVYLYDTDVTGHQTNGNLSEAMIVAYCYHRETGKLV